MTLPIDVGRRGEPEYYGRPIPRQSLPSNYCSITHGAQIARDSIIDTVTTWRGEVQDQPPFARLGGFRDDPKLVDLE